MTSKEERRLTKLINQGIRVTDVFFDDLRKRVSQDAKLSKDLGEFLVRTDDYTTGNIFASSGYAEGLSLLVMPRGKRDLSPSPHPWDHLRRIKPIGRKRNYQKR